MTKTKSQRERQRITNEICECGHESWEHSIVDIEQFKGVKEGDSKCVHLTDDEGYCSCKKFNLSGRKPASPEPQSPSVQVERKNAGSKKDTQSPQSKPLKTLTAKGVPILSRKEDKTADDILKEVLESVMMEGTSPEEAIKKAIALTKQKYEEREKSFLTTIDLWQKRYRDLLQKQKGEELSE